MEKQKNRVSSDFSGQRLDIGLDEIVPEYLSKNPLVRWLFLKRIYVVIDYLLKIEPKVLVDIGCGNGKLLELVSERDIQIQKMWGIDANPSIMMLQGKIRNCNFKVQDVLEIGFDDQSVDTAVCTDVLEHLEKAEKAAHEIKRILTRNGYLITSMPVESVLYRLLRFILKGTYSSESGPAAGEHYYNAKELDKIIRKVGFHRIASKKIPFYFPLDLFHLNLYRKAA